MAEAGAAHLNISRLLLQARLPVQILWWGQAKEALEAGAEQAGLLLHLQEGLQLAGERKTRQR